jgi:tape measure domain-containing protein
LVATVGSINVLFTVNYQNYERGVKRAASVTETEGGRMTKAVHAVDKATSQLNRTMSTIRGREFRVLALSALRAKDSVERLRGAMVAVSALAGGFGAAFTLKGLMDYSDTYKQIANRLRTVKTEAQGLADVEQKVFETAQKSRATYESTGILFSRIAGASRRLGVSQKDVLRVTETIQKAFVVGGSTPLEASQSAIQLSQGIASNRLQGDELRSVLENPALGQLLANKISGGDLGVLRKMAADGELTAKVIIDAFKYASGEIDKMFANTEKTISQAFIGVDNALLRYIGTSGKVKAASELMIGALDFLASNMSMVGDSVMMLGAAFIALIGAKGIGGAAQGLTGYITAMNATRQATAQAALATLNLANAEAAAASKRRSAAQAAYGMAYASGTPVSQKTKRKLGGELQSAMYAEAVATKAATSAQIAHAAAVTATGVASKASSVAVRGLGAAMNFLGGPVGVAILALSGVMMVLGARAADAQERADRYAEAIKRAGDNSENASAGIYGAAKAMVKLSEDSSEAIRIASLNKANNDIVAAFSDIEERVLSLGLTFQSLITGTVPQYVSKIKELSSLYKSGTIDISQFNAELDKLALANPDLADEIAAIQGIANIAEAAAGTVAGLTGELQRLGAATSRLKDDEAWPTEQIDGSASLFDRFSGDPKDSIQAQLKEQADTMRKAAESSARQARSDAAAERKRLKDEAKKASDSEITSSFDKYIDGMSKLRNQGTEMFLTEANLQIVETARSLGLAEEQIQAFIAAVRSGSDIPAQFQAIGYELNKITQNEQTIAMIDGLTGAFGDMFTALLNGTASAGEAFADFGKRIFEMVNQIMIVEPLVQGLRNALLGGFGGGGGGDPWAGMRVPMYHAGGTVGSGRAPGYKTVSGLNFAGAPRFKDGLGNDEFAAILHEGERVLTRDQTRSAMNVLGAAASGGAGGSTEVNIYNNSGAQVQESRRSSGNREIVDIVIGEVNKGIAGGKMDKSMGSRFGATPKRMQG